MLGEENTHKTRQQAENLPSYERSERIISGSGCGEKTLGLIRPED